MNAPASVDELLGLVRKSGIIDEKRLAAYLQKERPSPLPSEPKALAERLVLDGLLTHFQAEQFLQGKWRRFTLGNYKVLERIGAGGMGSVFLCEHKFMKRRAAVKVLPVAQSKDPSSLQRFYREARAVAALDHPNIVRAYDIDQEDNLHFLVMEYVDGSSLHEIVQRVGPLDPVRCAHYISQAALGLQHAHEIAGLVHRDIKPANIIVDRGGTVKVLDLGLARFFYDEEDLLTKKFDENVLGTADYLAPEQALDSHSVDIRGDIYSLGGTFYFCLTGAAPFAEGTVAQKLIWHQTRQPKPIRAFRSDVPEEMIAIISKMLAKDPEQRYQTPLELVLALEAWTQTSIAPPAEAEMPRLSLAARGNTLGEASSVTSPPASSISSRSRKIWQVPASPSPVPNVRSSPPEPAPPMKPAVAVPSASLPKGREPKAIAKPILSPAKEGPAAATSILPPELELADTPDEVAAQPEIYALPSQKEDSLPVELAADTEDLTAKADTEPPLKKRPVPRKLRRSKASTHARHRRQRRFWWWGGGILSGMLLVSVVIVVWAVLAREKHQDVGPALPPPLLVSRSAHGNAFPTIGEAIRNAKDKDHIVVLEDVEEQLELTGSKKELVVEASPGKSIVWRFPRNIASGTQMLLLNGVGHLRLRGFTLDGRNQVDQIAHLTGYCPGLVLEDVRLRGFRYYGILLAGCAGRQDDPVELVRVHAPLTERRDSTAAVAFLANPKINQHIIVSHCQFDGPYRDPIRLLGDASVIRDVHFEHNMPAALIGEPR
jgi:serine/threonine protein kinase